MGSRQSQPPRGTGQARRPQPSHRTGNDFIYPDNYTESLQTYLEYTGQVDADGKEFGT
ncbi:MAG: hypothetical protein HY334_08550 [Armatimonadetes bacterium]|nr:hypothetical protein [Armatimonadota bacterium]